MHSQNNELLREQGALVYTKFQNDKGEALCYRIYNVDGGYGTKFIHRYRCMDPGSLIFICYGKIL